MTDGQALALAPSPLATTAELDLEHVSPTLLAAVLDALPTPVFIKDAAGRFVAVNRAYERVAGFARAEIVGKSVHDLFPADLAERYAAADRAMYEEAAPQVYEVPMVVASGERRDNLVSKSVLHDARGDIAGLIGTFTDLTELRTAERELKDANERLEQRSVERTAALARANALLAASLESTADGILAIDSQRRVVACNERFLTMWGIPPSLLSSADDAALLRSVMSQLRDPTEFVRRVEELYAHPDEQAIDPVELKDGRRFDRYALPMRVLGEPPGRVWTFRDVSREWQLEHEMRHAQKMEAVGRLAGGVAHDFNNLLTVILTNLTLVAETLGPDHAALDDLGEIEAAALRAADLTRQLLTFSRKQILVVKPVDLNRLLEDMSRMLGRMVTERVKIELHCAPDLGLISADPGQLEQVIANLCVNARDAMPDGGVVVMRTRSLPAWQPPIGRGSGPLRAVELVVSDQGHGMTAEVRSRIFEPFFTTKERGKGTGLGLSTVFGIVTQGQGTIEVESAPGAGTTFRICWPCTDEVVATPATRAPVATQAGAATILLVEDEAALRRVVARRLCRVGHTVVEAANAAEAEQIAAGHDGPFDLLLTDIVMPGKSGIALARLLTEAAKVRQVLFMSGYADEADEPPPGAVIVIKPFAVDDLLGKVFDALRPSPPEPLAAAAPVIAAGTGRTVVQASISTASS